MDSGDQPRSMTLARASVLFVFLSIIIPLLLISCLAAGLSRTVSGCVVALAVLLVIPYATRVLPVRLSDDRARHRFLFALWVALTLFVSFRLATLSIFMLDAQKVQYAVNSTIHSVWTVSDPESKKPTHNCFTACAIAVHLAAQNVENIYQRKHYFAPLEEGTAFHRTIGDAFTIDPYQYPPPFLVLPNLILAIGHDFFQARTYWFVLNVLVCGAAVAVLATWLGGHDFNVYWLTWPLLLGAPAMLRTLQTGNVHLFIIALSVLAMVAFEKKKDWLGGALLGFAIVSKIFPGVLLAYLLIRRRWSAVLWTGVAIVALSLTVGLLFGLRPLDSFINYQLPRLVSGEAFDFTRKTTGLSVVSMSYKLQELGVLANKDPANVATIITWVYTGLVGILVIVVGMKHRTRGSSKETGGQRAPSRLALSRIWLVLLILAQLRSPFLPWGYTNGPVLLFLALAILSCEGWSWRRGLWLFGWLVFAVNVPGSLEIRAGAFNLWYMLTIQLGLIILCCSEALKSIRATYSPTFSSRS